MADRKPGLVVFCISNNHHMLPDQFFWSYVQMMKPNGSLAVKGSSSVKAASINDGIESALALGAEWMFLMDVDQIFPRTTIPRLLDTAKKHDAKIVSVLYHLGRPPFSPVAGWVKQTLGENLYVNEEGKPWRDHYAPLGRGVVEVDWVGSGGLLIHADVIKALEWPPFKDEWREGQGTRSLGHDMLFCKRAKQKGFKILVDTAVVSPHGKLMYFDQAWAESYDASGMDQVCKDFVKFQTQEQEYWDTLWQDEHIRKHDRAEAPSYKKTFDRIVELVPESAKVVDLGSGTGGLLKVLRKHRAIKGTGIDFSEKAIEILTQDGFEGEVADLRHYEPNGSSNQFDVAISTHTIEHLQNDENLVRGMAALVRPGGRVILATPSDKLVQAHVEHVRGYDAATLKALLEGAGIKNVEVEDNGRDFVAYGNKEEA